MKISFFFKTLLLACILSSFLCSSSVSKLIKKVIKNIMSTIPQLKQEIKNYSTTSTTNVSKIVQSGFTTFSQEAKMFQFLGVEDAKLTEFLNYLKTMIQLPEQTAKYFVDNLSMIIFSDFNEIVIYKVVFSVERGGDCKYVCVMGQHNYETNSTDWLVGDLKSFFTLAPDMIVLETNKSSLFGLIKSTKVDITFVPQNLSEDQLATLFKFFEIIVFERFAELIQIGDNSELKFLEN